MGLNCCIASGPRGLFTFPLTAVMGRKDGLQVNFFAGGTYRLQTPGKQTIKLVQETDYPVNGKIRIQVELPKSEEMTIRVRVPGWSKQTTLTVNGEMVNAATAGQYAIIQRKWNSGDAIILDLDMRGRVVKLGKQPENIAIVRGPVVFARDSRFNDGDVDEACSFVQKDGYVELTPVSNKPADIWMEFTAPLVLGTFIKQPVPIHFCDYASACEKWDSPERYRVWLQKTLDVTIEPQPIDSITNFKRYD